MSLYLFLFFVLQLATEEPAVGNRTARNWKPDSPQLRKRSFYTVPNGILHHNTSGKKDGMKQAKTTDVSHVSHLTFFYIFHDLRHCQPVVP